MPILKHSVAGVQGYADGQRARDIATLTALYDENNDDIRGTIVGAACEAVRPAVEKKLKEVFADMKKLLPDDVVVEVTRTDENGNEVKEPVKDVSVKMGPLKKVRRIMEKAVHYACEDNTETIQIQRVRDILRATIVFPPAAWRAKGIGTAFIDAVNARFHGKVIQVSNRFIEKRYPNLALLDGLTLPDDLSKQIESLHKQTLHGRDTFYRDMQLLIRIDNDDFANEQGMTHTIFELQLASSAMYGAKVFKTKDNESGHEMYRTTRAATEYCEYLYWMKTRKAAPKLRGAAGFYNVSVDQWEKFPKALETMGALYRSKYAVEIAANLADAIDNSEWYKNLEDA